MLADERSPEGQSVEFNEFLVLPRVGVYGRAAVHVDAIDAAIAAGELTTPKAGDTVSAPDGRIVEWKPAKMNGGKLATRSIVGGYAATTYEAPDERILLLRANGHAIVYVNGVPHAGDPYAVGNFRLPVRVNKGLNTFIFHVAQRELKASLEIPDRELQFSTSFGQFPNAVRQVASPEQWAALTLINTSEQPLENAKLIATVGEQSTATNLAWLDSAALRIVPFKVPPFSSPGEAAVDVTVRVEANDQTLASESFQIEIVEPDAVQMCTFRSRVDNSVQSYAFLPAVESEGSEKAGVILALHNAGVDAREFASHYAAKPWAHVIAPSGRSKYPFDWEDWARLDAIEALDDAQQRLEVDKNRVFITGHSMGGHGALVLAATQPSRFAAVGTSAAWPSLWTYGGGMPDYRDPNAVQAILRRAANPSDTLQFLSNLRHAGVYLLHGADDKRVPVEQSRLLLQNIATNHDDFAFFEKKGSGHWWGRSTVDWPEMMEFFAVRKRSDLVPQRVVFATADLGTSASSHWATIATQETAFEISRIDLSRRTSPHSIVGKTENVSRLVFDKSAMPQETPFAVRLDDSRPIVFSGMPASGTAWVEKIDGQWRRGRSPNRRSKGPKRYGGMKAVFDRNVLLVYGTQGSEAENRWARGKAHFDAQTFAYRAGGSLEVIPDTLFDERTTRDRNVVVYGNVNTNDAWAALLSTSPVQVRSSSIEVGFRRESGEGLGVLMVRPRSRNAESLVGAIGGTNLRGMQTTNRLRYFWSGVAYPDLTILGTNALNVGDNEVRAAGYFADDWMMKDADIAWRDTAL